jgi:hypothetical protein
MKKAFIETQEFTELVRHYVSDDALADLQRELLNDPAAGAVIPGCGGRRKMRVADPRRGEGKRGEVLVIYLHIEERDQIHLSTVYGKDQKDDLSADDKKSYRRLVQILQEQSPRAEEM